MLACDAAAHRAMLIVGRFFTGRRARQRTACLGISGLAHLSSDNIASRDRLIASAAYCRVCYSTTTALVASIASHAADAGRLQCLCAQPLRAERLESSLKASCTFATPAVDTNETDRAPTKPETGDGLSDQLCITILRS